LAGGQFEHLSFEEEIVSILRAAEDPFVWWADDFHLQVVQFEGVVRPCCVGMGGIGAGHERGGVQVQMFESIGHRLFMR